MHPIIALYTDNTHHITQWRRWLEASGFEVYCQPGRIPMQSTHVLCTRAWLQANTGFVNMVRATAPMASILCATDQKSASQVVQLGVDDVIIYPIARAVLINRLWHIFQQNADHDVNFAEVLQQTTAALASTLNLDEALRLILTQIKRVIPACEAANIVLIEPDGVSLQIMRGMTFFEEGITDKSGLENFELDLPQLPNLLRMQQTGQALIVHDTTRPNAWVDMKDTAWIRSYIGAPILIEEHVVGFINVDSGTPHTFTTQHTNQLQAFAYHAGLAIQNMRLFEQLTDLATHLEARVLDSTCELKAEKAQLQAILDSIGEGVIYHNADGQPIYINRALEELFGYNEHAWLHQEVEITTRSFNLDEQNKLATYIKHSLERNGIWQQEMRLQRRDGSQFEAQVTTRPVIRESGHQDGTVTVYRDISQERALQDRQERFVAYASHELRTPITNIKTQLYLVHRKPQEADTHLNIIEEVVDRMEGLVESLLTMSKLNNQQVMLETQEIDLADVVRAVYRVQKAEATRKGVRLALHLPNTPHIIRGDPNRLIQVITNLTMNALMHTANNAQITIEITMEPHLHLNMVHSNTDLMLPTDVAWAGVKIKDQGVGIDPEHLPHLFQPFYRVANNLPGTGLGLAIAAEIARLHKGTLEVQSVLGVGSTFTLWLPMVRVPEETTP